MNEFISTNTFILTTTYIVIFNNEIKIRKNLDKFASEHNVDLFLDQDNFKAILRKMFFFALLSVYLIIMCFILFSEALADAMEVLHGIYCSFVNLAYRAAIGFIYFALTYVMVYVYVTLYIRQ